MKTNVDVCVVGAGPVGATLACRLAAQGVRVAVVDRAALPPMEHPAFDGRAYAIASGSRRLLEDAGVWDSLPLPSCPIHDIRVTDGKVGRAASRLHLHFDHQEIGQPFGWMVEARSLRVALNRHMNEQANIHLHAPVEARVERRPDGATVFLSDGGQIECRLVVAAEGRESPLRRQAGIAVTRLPYHQTGIVCAIAHDKPHHETALEHFLPGGPFAQLPMCGTEDEPHVSAIVWTDRTPMTKRFLALDEATFAREISRRMGTHLGQVRPIGRRWHYPLSAMYVHRIVAQRLALVGDAAHGVHPIAGQGLNLGFQDVIALADLLIQAVQSGEDAGADSVLNHYQARRRLPNLAMLGATDVLDRLFSNDNPALRLARDVGLALVERAPPLKRMFMRQATGLSVFSG